jgi:hypothetical protein
MKFPNGTSHEGNWVKGAPNGKGIFKDKNGKVVYEGDFLNGDRTGKGIQHFPDGARYEGDHLKGQFHGNGILYGPDGKIIMQGKWEHNKFVSGATPEAE